MNTPESGEIEVVEYDEFGLFHENISEFDLDVREIPPVGRVSVDVGADRDVSALQWGSAPPEIVSDSELVRLLTEVVPDE